MSSLEAVGITSNESETQKEVVVMEVLMKEIKMKTPIKTITESETVPETELETESKTECEKVAVEETKVEKKENFAINLITQYANYTDEEFTSLVKADNEDNILLFEIDATQNECFSALKAQTSLNEQIKITREGSPYNTWTVHIVTEADKFKIVLSKVAPVVQSSWYESVMGCNIC